MHPEFSDNYTRAREDAADFFVQEIMEIADAAEVDDVQVARLRVDTRKWTASRFNRAYEEKQKREHTGADGGPIGINAAVVAAEMTNEEAANVYKDLMG